MTKRLPVHAAPGPLEAYVQHFDALLSRQNQRDCLRRYLEGLLLPSERTKTLTALANTEPIVGAQQPAAQRLQWFLSEAAWDVTALTQCRIDVLRRDPVTAPSAAGVLIVDETGDRKDGTRTAHVGRQYLANLGKIDNGVVSVSTVWADERVYYPVEVEPYTPAHHFAHGKHDPVFRTKPAIALDLITRAVASGIPCRAVLADAFYGEHVGFLAGLEHLDVGYVVALKPSHAWWHVAGTIGSLVEAAGAAGWTGADAPGGWQRVERNFRDGHRDAWWALEVVAGAYGPERRRRAVVVTTDPQTLPEHGTWYLLTNLPAVGAVSGSPLSVAPADLAELVRLYGLRMWVEQSYKQVKHRLGWSQYQVRSDRAMRRHWELVCCAFCFCWWAHGATLLQDSAAPRPPDTDATAAAPLAREKNPATHLLAGGATAGTQLAGAMDTAHALVAGLVATVPAEGVADAAGRVVARAGHPAL